MAFSIRIFDHRQYPFENVAVLDHPLVSSAQTDALPSGFAKDGSNAIMARITKAEEKA